MKYIKFILFVLLLIPSILLNAKDEHRWATQKAKGYKYKYVTEDPTNSRFYTLANGMTVILSPNHKEPRMHVYIAVKAGSKTDPATQTGLAHYLEHLMFKGTEYYGSLNYAAEKPLLAKIQMLYEEYNHTKNEDKRKEIYHKIDSVSGKAAKFAIANEYDKIMSSIGAKGSNAFTSFEETVYTEDIPANTIDKYLRVQAERFGNPVFRIFHTELEAVYEEKNRTLDNNNRKVSETLLANLFLNHNYGKQTTIGTIEHLKNPSLVEIRRYFNIYYVPNNMGIIVSGDFDPDKVIKLIDSNFKHFESKPLPNFTFKQETPIVKPVIKEVSGPDAEFVTIGYRFPGVHSKDALLADLVGQMLTNGKAGVIDINLIKKQKLLKASASANILVDYGWLNIQGTPTMGQSLEDVKNLMIEQIENLKNGKFDKELILSIINNQKKNMMLQNQDYSSCASALMSAFTGEEDWLDDVDYINRLSKITKRDVVEFANNYFGDNYVVVYKRKGDDKNTFKVVKPPITAVETNRNEQSDYAKKIIAMPVDNLKPVWLNYNKDIQKGEIGPAEFLYVPNNENGLFKMSYRYKIGTWNEKKLAIAAQYLQFLGTETKKADIIAKEFYKLACSYNINTDNEYTTINIEGINENFEQAITLFDDLLNNCMPDEDALKSLKARLNKSRMDAKNNKNAIMQGLMSYARFGADNPFKYVLTNEEINNLTSAELIDILHNLNSNSHTINYYGPETKMNLITLYKKNHKMPDYFKASPAPKVFTFTTQTNNTVLFADYDMVQSEIRWIRNVMPNGYDFTKQPVINYFNSYFGGDMGAIVFQTIRESKALAYSTNARIITPDKKEDPYLATAYIGCQADKFNEAVVAMNELLNQLPKVDNSIKAAKSSVKKDLESERIMRYDIISNYLAAERKGLNEDIRKRIYEHLDQLGYDDLKLLHEDNLAKKTFTYCVLASQNKIKPEDLQKIGELKVLSLEEIFGY